MIPYFDAHCDTVSRCLQTGESLRRNGGQLDLERDAAFARRAQFFALYHDAKYAPPEGMWAQCRRLYDCYLRQTEESADLVRRCRTGAEAEAAVTAGKTAAFLSIEGADLLDCDPERVEAVSAWGVKLMNLTWNRHNALSGTHREEPERGLGDRGRAFVRQLERCGIYADVSHLSDAGFWDLAEMAERPFVASHSNARALCPHSRNLTDDMFRAIRDSGGVVGLNFYKPFVGGQASLADLADHAEHFLALGGEKTLCLGGDLDGCEVLAGDMAGLQDVPRLYEEMERRGWGRDLLEDLFWNNLMRLL